MPTLDRRRAGAVGLAGVKKLLTAMFVALLMVGCGGVEKSGSDDNESALAPPVADPQKVAVVDKWAEWVANPEPYGGLEVLAKIKEAEESGATELDLGGNEISDLSPLKGLTNLKELDLEDNPIPEDRKAMLKKALPDCKISF